MLKKVPLPDYMPDQSQNSGVLLKAENVFPAMDGYRSIGEVLTVSDALAAAFKGGSSAISTGGTAYLLAGTATNLYKVGSNGAWTSLVGSLTITGRWRFTQFGDYAIAVNGSATRAINLSTSTDGAIAGAPTFTSVCVVGDYVVGGQSNSVNNMVRWSAFRDHTGWTNGTNQAGEQPMQTGGTVMGVAGGEYGIILQRERLVRMTRTGDSTAPFQFDEISSNFGCAAGATIAQAGRTIFFRSDRGFMALEDGQVLKPIGSEKVDRTFDSLVSRDDLESIYTAVDPQNKLVMWGVPGSPGTLWIYNFELDKWSTARFAFEGIMPGFTTSIGLDDLAVTYTNLDTMTISLDDPRWQGGNPRLYLFDTTHKLGTLHGDKLAAEFELGYSEFVPGRLTRTWHVRPVWDGAGGMTMILNAKARLGDSDSIASTSTLRSSGVMPVRATGRYIATEVQIAAETDWDYIQSLEFEFEPGGKR